MPATPEQKVRALDTRCNEALTRYRSLLQVVREALFALTSPVIAPTLSAADKLQLLGQYSVRRSAWLGLAGSEYRTPAGAKHDLTSWIPADVVAWEPEAAEYEE